MSDADRSPVPHRHQTTVGADAGLAAVETREHTHAFGGKPHRHTDTGAPWWTSTAVGEWEVIPQADVPAAGLIEVPLSEEHHAEGEAATSALDSLTEQSQRAGLYDDGESDGEAPAKVDASAADAKAGIGMHLERLTRPGGLFAGAEDELAGWATGAYNEEPVTSGEVYAEALTAAFHHAGRRPDLRPLRSAFAAYAAAVHETHERLPDKVILRLALLEAAVLGEFVKVVMGA